MKEEDEDQVVAAQMSFRGTPWRKAANVETGLAEWALTAIGKGCFANCPFGQSLRGDPLSLTGTAIGHEQLGTFPKGASMNNVESQGMSNVQHVQLVLQNIPWLRVKRGLRTTLSLWKIMEGGTWRKLPVH